jgi:hypothetical protein
MTAAKNELLSSSRPCVAGRKGGFFARFAINEVLLGTPNYNRAESSQTTIKEARKSGIPRTAIHFRLEPLAVPDFLTSWLP